MSTVATTAVLLGNGSCLIQNLGSGILYVGESSSVSASTGVKLASGVSVAMGAATAPIYGISDTSCDVRVLPRGQGIF